MNKTNKIFLLFYQLTKQLLKQVQILSKVNFILILICASITLRALSYLFKNKKKMIFYFMYEFMLLVTKFYIVKLILTLLYGHEN